MPPSSSKDIDFDNDAHNYTICCFRGFDECESAALAINRNRSRPCQPGMVKS